MFKKNDSLNRSEWVHHYSKIPIQQQSLTIYQTHSVTLWFITFRIKQRVLSTYSADCFSILSEEQLNVTIADT